MRCTSVRRTKKPPWGSNSRMCLTCCTMISRLSPSFCWPASQGGSGMTKLSPYPGLRPFQQDEAALFFGREVQVEAMLARLEDHRFLAVVGTSGCGKSSLCGPASCRPWSKAFCLMPTRTGHSGDAPGRCPLDQLTAALLDEAALGRERRSASQAAAYCKLLCGAGPWGWWRPSRRATCLRTPIYCSSWTSLKRFLLSATDKKCQ